MLELKHPSYPALSLDQEKSYKYSLYFEEMFYWIVMEDFSCSVTIGTIQQPTQTHTATR